MKPLITRILILAALLLAGCLTEPKERVRVITCKERPSDPDDPEPITFTVRDTLCTQEPQ
jgi:hypothetical protein